MKVSEALGVAVRAEGVTSIFGLMGDGNMFFLAHLLDQGEIKIYDTRHEGSAVAMADGYARATGDVGVATVTCGPGVTQLGTSLTVASRHGSPVVVIAGDVATFMKGMGGQQDTDQRAFAQASGALFHQLRGPGTVAADVQHAFWLARTRRQPVLLNCPVDLQGDTFAGAFRYVPSRSLIPAIPPSVPDAAAIEKAADMLAAARHPVLVMGAGALSSDTRLLIEAIADRLGAATATTLRAKGYLDGAWSVGLCGSFSTIGAESVLAAADLVVLIGASGSVETAAAIPTTARTLHINTNPLVSVGYRQPDHIVCGDAKVALERITQVLDEADYHSDGFRNGFYNELFGLDPVAADLEQAHWDPQPATVDPRIVVQQLDHFLPKECTVVIGAGHFWSFPAMFLNGHRSRRFFYTHDFGCIGQALPTAFGVSVGIPALPVVVFEGDASVMMHIHEFDTTARYQPRMLVFIMNDGALGAEYHKLQAGKADPKWSLIRPPDFTKVAEAFGNEGGTITSMADVEREVTAFASGSATRYVDVRVSPAVISPSYRKYYSG